MSDHYNINRRTCMGCSERQRAATGVHTCLASGNPTAIDTLCSLAGCPLGLHVGPADRAVLAHVETITLTVRRLDAAARQTAAVIVARPHSASSGRPCCGEKAKTAEATAIGVVLAE